MICGYNALDDACKIIKEKFRYFKVVVIVETTALKVFEDFISNISTIVKSVDMVQIPNKSREYNVILSLVQSKISEDVGLIINLTGVDVTGVVKTSNIKTMQIINSPSLEVIMQNYDYVLCDYNLLNNCNSRELANCYGQLCSLCFFVLEQVFCKAVYQKSINNQQMLEIEDCIHSLSMIPYGVLKSAVGKELMINLCVKVKHLINILDYEECFVYKLANQVIDKNRGKSINVGEASVIATTIAFKTMNVLLRADRLNHLVGYSYYDRMNFFKQQNSKFSLSQIYKSFICDNSLEEHITNFRGIQRSFIYVFDTYCDIFSHFLKTFKKLYFDNSFQLQKYMSENVLLLAVNSLPESCDKCCYATFVRDVGLMNSLIV